MAGGSGRRWRQLAVWLHVITSVGWMGQALALISLNGVVLATGDPVIRTGAAAMALHLDLTLLAPLANASAFTGFMLAAGTPWGFFRHYWVLVKFAITVVQLNLGIFVLHGALRHAADAARGGSAGASVALIVGSALMASAIAFQAWASIAKPWNRTPWSPGDRRAAGTRPPTASDRMFAATVLAPVLDLTVGLLVGFPTPLAEAVVLVVRLATRRRRARGTPSGPVAMPGGATG